MTALSTHSNRTGHTREATIGRPTSTGSAVRATGLTKAYAGRTVVDSLDLELPTGVVSGFVGPNGAGKTTTIRMLLGLVRPTAGSGEVLGHSLQHPNRYLPAVGAMIEGPTFTGPLSGADNLAVLARAGGLPLSRVPQVLDRGLLLAGRARCWSPSPTSVPRSRTVPGSTRRMAIRWSPRSPSGRSGATFGREWPVPTSASSSRCWPRSAMRTT